MRAVMIMFDSLNRHMLPSYGCSWTHAPNFERLAAAAVTFDNCYAGSLPCMPARRELHTGRYNFLHRSWGPLEPFDDSVIDELRRAGVYTHLSTDHPHYFEDGGATYHTRYNTWEFARGQEGDPWKGHVEDPDIPQTLSGPKLGSLWRQDWVNRTYLDTEEKQPMAVVFGNGMEFIEKNREQDQWFLQIEAFDPHEPFFTQEKYKELYPHLYEGKHLDWPDYGRSPHSSDVNQHVVYEYAALLSMCDAYLGQVLDLFDRYELWKDTMLIVNTDHGYLLGEHQWWGKNIQPFYNEITNLPLFVWDPRYGQKGKRSEALVQTIDIPATLIDFFGAEHPRDMQGQSIAQAIQGATLREAALFGIHGGHINVTDGRYVYMRAPQSFNNSPLREYTLMPTHMHTRFQVSELSDLKLREPFSFTKNCRTLEIETQTYLNPYLHGTLLFDLEADPKQASTIEDLGVEARLIQAMAAIMRDSDAPLEQYERIGIPVDGVVDEERLQQEKTERRRQIHVDLGLQEEWTDEGRTMFFAAQCLAPPAYRANLKSSLTEYLRRSQSEESLLLVDETVLMTWLTTLGEPAQPLIRAIRTMV